MRRNRTKPQLIKLAELWGCVFVSPRVVCYTTKKVIWETRVPVDKNKFNDEGHPKTVKVLEDESYTFLLTKTERFFRDRQNPIKIILRETRGKVTETHIGIV